MQGSHHGNTVLPSASAGVTGGFVPPLGAPGRACAGPRAPGRVAAFSGCATGAPRGREARCSGFSQVTAGVENQWTGASFSGRCHVLPAMSGPRGRVRGFSELSVLSCWWDAAGIQGESPSPRGQTLRSQSGRPTSSRIVPASPERGRRQLPCGVHSPLHYERCPRPLAVFPHANLLSRLSWPLLFP